MDTSPNTPEQQPTPPTVTATPIGLTSDQVAQSFMPTQNMDSIISYYLGFVGLFPVIGLPFAIAAIVYGRKAMKKFHTNPTPGAKGHAVTGITLGIIALVLWALFIIVVLIAAMNPSNSA